MKTNYSQRPSDDENFYDANRIFRDIVDRYETKIYQKRISINDIRRNTVEFANDINILNRFQVRIPAMQVRNTSVPVSLRVLFNKNWPFFAIIKRHGEGPGMDAFLSDLLQPLKDEDLDGIHTIQPYHARQNFVELATDFLRVRLEAAIDLPKSFLRKWWEPDPKLTLRDISGEEINVPGCTFRVITKTKGLWVYWSGAYFISQNYFSAPTSPVESVLQAGHYVFGVNGGGYGDEIRWDMNSVVTLPGTPSVHLKF